LNSPVAQDEKQQEMMEMQRAAREDFLRRYGQKI
jgi:hypothetical protein